MEELLQDFADKEVVYSATGEKLRVINSSSLWSVAGPIDYVKNYYPFGTPYSGDALADNPDHYNERGMSYTQNGALTRLLRYGKRNTEDFGLIDSLTITLDGNRVHSVNDGAGNLVYSNSFDFKHSAPKPYENPFIYRGSTYRYDDNGRLTYDPDKRALFSYDQTGNLKRFDRGSVIEYVYSSTGEKLCQFINLLTYAEKPTIFGTDTGPVITTGALSGPKPSNITSHLIYGQDVKLSHQHCTDFTGPFIIYYGKLDKFLFDGGYCTFKDGDVSFHYYQQDHLGNNRAVVSEDGTVEQTTEYYPFGGIYGDVSTSPGLQPYKYNGKMFVHSLGLDLYNYGARMYDPALVVWNGVDPLAEKYCDISPYAYCVNNPVNAIDPDGKRVWVFATKLPSEKGGDIIRFATHTFVVVQTSKGKIHRFEYGPQGDPFFGISTLRQLYYDKSGNAVNNYMKGIQDDCIKNVIEVNVPTGMTMDEFNKNVINSAAEFSDNTEIKYRIVPIGETEGNCNTSTTSLLKNAGVSNKEINRIRSVIKGVKTGLGTYKPWTYKERQQAIKKKEERLRLSESLSNHIGF